MHLKINISLSIMDEINQIEQENISKRVFFKKTRNGNVIRIVRENIVRNDLGYGFFAFNDKNSSMQQLASHMNMSHSENMVDLSKSDANKNETSFAMTFKHTSPASSFLPLTKQQLSELVSQSPHKHLLVVDTNIVMHQIDLLEYQCPATSLVLITQTVLQEIQHINLAVYRRLNLLLQDEKRSYIFYPNEVSADTAVLR
jgi:hypothetical protein